MQRPARIMTFAVLCLVVGAVSGLQNLSELAVAVVGPDMLPEAGDAGMGNQFMQMMDEQAEATRRALSDGPYRLIFGVNSLAGALMAIVLITAGVGLMMDKLVALKLTKVWAYFALVSGVVTVVLNARYVMSQMPSAPPGGAVMMGVCMLPLLWLFPILLLTVLGRPGVAAYLRWKADAVMPSPVLDGTAGSTNPPPSQTQAPIQSADTASPSASRTPPPATEAKPNQTPSASQTWRDDPWNDSGI